MAGARGFLQGQGVDVGEPKPTAIWTGWAPQLLSVLRIAAGFLFMWPGSMKLFGFPIAMPTGAGAVFGSQLWFGGVLEFTGGILLLVGKWTRPVAFILSGEMAVAYWQFHAPRGFWPIANAGMDAALFCFVFLYLSAAGGGPWSLDARTHRGPGERPWWSA